MHMKRNMTALAASIIAMILSTSAVAYQIFGTEDTAPWQTYTQPDCYQTEFDAKVWGNSIWWEHEEENGYTIVFRPSNGYWTYAILDSSGYYTYSDYRVAIDTPPSSIQPHLRRSEAAEDELVDMLEDFEDEVDARSIAYNNDHAQVQVVEHPVSVLFFEFDDLRHVSDVNHTCPK